MIVGIFSNYIFLAEELVNFRKTENPSEWKLYWGSVIVYGFTFGIGGILFYCKKKVKLPFLAILNSVLFLALYMFSLFTAMTLFKNNLSIYIISFIAVVFAYYIYKLQKVAKRDLKSQLLF